MRTGLPLFAALLLTCNFGTRADEGGRDWESAQRIRDAATRYVLQQSAPTARADAGALDARLRVPACPRALSANAPAPGNASAWSVSVSCEAGPGGTPLWSIYVPVKVSDFRSVVVLSRPLSPGQTIDASAIRLEQRDIATLSYGYLDAPEKAIGQVLKRPLAQGATLTPDAVTPQKVVKRGNEVTIISRSGAIEVRAQGKALGDGGAGERIQVENLSSHRIVDAMVRDGGSVEVKL